MPQRLIKNASPDPPHLPTATNEAALLCTGLNSFPCWPTQNELANKGNALHPLCSQLLMSSAIALVGQSRGCRPLVSPQWRLTMAAVNKVDLIQWFCKTPNEVHHEQLVSPSSYRCHPLWLSVFRSYPLQRRHSTFAGCFCVPQLLEAPPSGRYCLCCIPEEHLQQVSRMAGRQSSRRRHSPRRAASRRAPPRLGAAFFPATRR